MAAEFTCDIAIIGGGMGGLALAAGLMSRGFDAHVFEGAPELRTSTSTIISLGPNAMYALQELDPSLPDSVRDGGYALQQTNIIKRPPGADELSRTGPGLQANTWIIMWSRMQEILAQKVPAINVHCSHRCVGYEESPDDGMVNVLFKDKPTIRAKLVVGADGVRSVIRKQLLPSDPGPRYLGQMNWNALLHNPSAPVANLVENVQLIHISDGADSIKYTTNVFITQAAEGVMFWQVRVEFQQPSWTQGEKGGPGLGIPGSKKRVLDHLKNLGWSETLAVVEDTPESSIFERAMCDLLPIPSWSSKSKRVVLLGDAAHAMHSSPGMGARTAYEDAHQLVEALVAHGLDNVEAAVDQYEGVRVQRCAIVQCVAATAARLTRINEAHGLAATQVGQEQYMQCYREFMQWANDYPNNPSGDSRLEWMTQLVSSIKQQWSNDASLIDVDGQSLQGQPEVDDLVAGELPAFMYAAAQDKAKAADA